MLNHSTRFGSSSGKKVCFRQKDTGTDPWNPDPRSATLLNRIPTGSCPWGGRWGVHGPFVDSTGTGSVLFCSHGFGSGCQLREVSWLRIRIKDADTNLRGTKKQKPVTEVKIELNTKSKDFF